MKDNSKMQRGIVGFNDRCDRLKQQGMVVWFTGLSGSGKSTITAELENYLFQQGYLVYRLDGDNIRHGLNNDLGFSKDDRTENVRRIAEVASLFRDAGFITLVSVITPLENMRTMAKNIIGKEYYKEIYVDAQLETCIKRDPKGLYKKALDGEILQFTGISDAFEIPQCSDKVLNTIICSIDQCVDDIKAYLKEIGCIE
ncbi:MAG: adenylyl-sulfate kinase [Rickettsiales bacterium]|jgi:adenylyl-sulfate kinase|nr:adenylyl-sulfate kinase [Rickettsiales bacterium]